jgi:hypothetical protein
MISRRLFVMGGGSALAGLGVAVVAGCRKPDSTLACTDVSALSPSEASVRKGTLYVDRSKDADRTCETCQQWVAPPAPGACGGCKLVKGPVHPQGSCKLYAPRG